MTIEVQTSSDSLQLSASHIRDTTTTTPTTTTPAYPVLQKHVKSLLKIMEAQEVALFSIPSSHVDPLLISFLQETKSCNRQAKDILTEALTSLQLSRTTTRDDVRSSSSSISSSSSSISSSISSSSSSASKRSKRGSVNLTRQLSSYSSLRRSGDRVIRNTFQEGKKVSTEPTTLKTTATTTTPAATSTTPTTPFDLSFLKTSNASTVSSSSYSTYSSPDSSCSTMSSNIVSSPSLSSSSLSSSSSSSSHHVQAHIPPRSPTMRSRQYYPSSPPSSSSLHLRSKYSTLSRSISSIFNKKPSKADESKPATTPSPSSIPPFSLSSSLGVSNDDVTPALSKKNPQKQKLLRTLNRFGFVSDEKTVVRSVRITHKKMKEKDGKYQLKEEKEKKEDKKEKKENDDNRSRSTSASSSTNTAEYNQWNQISGFLYSQKREAIESAL